MGILDLPPLEVRDIGVGDTSEDVVVVVVQSVVLLEGVDNERGEMVRWELELVDGGVMGLHVLAGERLEVVPVAEGEAAKLENMLVRSSPRGDGVELIAVDVKGDENELSGGVERRSS